MGKQQTSVPMNTSDNNSDRTRKSTVYRLATMGIPTLLLLTVITVGSNYGGGVSTASGQLLPPAAPGGNMTGGNMTGGNMTAAPNATAP